MGAGVRQGGGSPQDLHCLCYTHREVEGPLLGCVRGTGKGGQDGVVTHYNVLILYMHVWQSRVEIVDYSVAYFDRIAASVSLNFC